jgi:hypothetical protein
LKTISGSCFWRLPCCVSELIFRFSRSLII